MFKKINLKKLDKSFYLLLVSLVLAQRERYQNILTCYNAIKRSNFLLFPNIDLSLFNLPIQYSQNS